MYLTNTSRDITIIYKHTSRTTRPIVTPVNKHAIGLQVTLPLPAKNAAVCVQHDAYAVAFSLADAAFVPETCIVKGEGLTRETRGGKRGKHVGESTSRR